MYCMGVQDQRSHTTIHILHIYILRTYVCTYVYINDKESQRFVMHRKASIRRAVSGMQTSFSQSGGNVLRTDA